MSNELKLVIDSKAVKLYNQYYFNLHPKARKEPIESPIHPSINKWMIMKRMAMNQLKQKWKDFVVWHIRSTTYENAQIEKCSMKFISYYKTKTRHDIDNFIPKFILDGMVDAGFIVDDDDKHLTSLTLECEYDKKLPRTEIYVTPFVEKATKKK